jgi:hypothetical protein
LAKSPYGKKMNKPISTKHYLPLGAVRSVEETPRGLLLGVGDERFRVDVLSNHLLRLKISQAKVFDEEPTFSVVGADTPSVAFEVHQNDTEVTIATKQVKLVIQRDPFALSAYRADGTVLCFRSRSSFISAASTRDRPMETPVAGIGAPP